MNKNNYHKIKITILNKRSLLKKLRAAEAEIGTINHNRINTILSIIENIKKSIDITESMNKLIKNNFGVLGEGSVFDCSSLKKTLSELESELERRYKK